MAITCASMWARVANAGDWGTVSVPGLMVAFFGLGRAYCGGGAGWAAARALVASLGVWLLVTGRAGTGRTLRSPRLLITAALHSHCLLDIALEVTATSARYSAKA
jgi:hypothetical protein